jgi:hypothetical protein
MFQMCGVFAEFERSMIVERVNAGLATARANGVRLGRGNRKDDQWSADEQRWGRNQVTVMRVMKRLGIAGKLRGPRDVTADPPGEEKFQRKAICLCKLRLQSQPFLWSQGSF